MSSISPGGSGNRNGIPPQDIPSEEVNDEAPFGVGKKNKKTSGEMKVGSKDAKVSTSASNVDKQGVASCITSAAHQRIDPETAAASVSSSLVGDIDTHEVVKQLEDERDKFLERLCNLCSAFKDLFKELEDVQFSIEVFKHNDVLTEGKDSRRAASHSPQEQFREAVNRVGNQIILEKQGDSLLATLQESHRAAERILHTSDDLLRALSTITPDDLRRVFPNCYTSIMNELKDLGIEYSGECNSDNTSEWGLQPNRGLSSLFTQIQNLTDQGIQELQKFHYGENSALDSQLSVLHRFWICFLQKLNQLYQNMLFFVFWVVRSLRRLICGVEKVDPKLGDPQGRAGVNIQEFAGVVRVRRADLSEEDAIQRADSSSTSVEPTRKEEEQNNDSGQDADSEHEETEQDEQNQQEDKSS